MKFFLSHRLYGERPRFYWDAYMAGPGWACLKLGNWTLEIEWDETGPLASLLPDGRNPEEMTHESTVFPETRAVVD